MCQLSVITQVWHSFCRCHCFDGVSTCPLALCSLPSKDSLRQHARCLFVSLFFSWLWGNRCLSASKCFIYTVGFNKAWTKFEICTVASVTQLKCLDITVIFSSLVLWIITKLWGGFVVERCFILWESLERKCNVTPITVYTPVSCFPWLE